ncbi:hypothetical protein VTN77DRAFT_7832 [Rasamsonia byssochlamydoides]|uniref:uncharacterized protein n=1 Tax=Rasamsonia byssochlamydoides TaxID=89139 RepID=UPI003742BA14
MRLRGYAPDDAWAIAEIEALCNLTDPLALYYRRIQGNNNNYDDGIKDERRNWTAYVTSCQRFQEMKLLQPGTICHVLEERDELSSHAEQQDGGNYDSVIVGFTIWTRVGKSEVARRWQKRGRRWSTRLRAVAHYLGIALYYPLDSTIDRRRMSQVYPIISQPPVDVDPNKLSPERWEIDAMYTHPRCQRRGFGTQALQWGLDQATRERVPVLVKSTSRGYHLYCRAGFRSVGSLDFGGLFDPGEPGMHLMLWEPG